MQNLKHKFTKQPAMEEHYEGVGILAINVQKAKVTLKSHMCGGMSSSDN